ncbi:hypothetical protein ACJ6WF_11870 [Streptomyces sp. MMS24-I2-30]|uniref:hypothetical protein n=1 Tax=Streptomyces sp. MMS24-I2-30 TaxID=3351564 RepID=UPI003896A44E
MPITQERPQGQEHQEKEQRARQQLERALGQLQKLLKQREDSLKLRQTWSGLSREASPEEHLQQLEVQRRERGRQQKMREFTDRLVGLAETLLQQQGPAQAQGQSNPEVSDARRLQELKEQCADLDRRELQQLRQEQAEHGAGEPLPGAEQGQPLTPVQQRMQQVGQRVEQVTDEMARLHGRPGHGSRTSSPQHAVRPTTPPARTAGQGPSTPVLAEGRRDRSVQEEPSGLNSSVASAAADYAPGVNSRQSSSPAPRPQTAAPASTAYVAASHGENRRSR